MNKSQYIFLSILIALFWLFPLSVQAEKNYASDQVEVLLRTGASHQHAIVKMLKSGAALKVLERDRKSGYSRVRTDGGAEGWVLTRHLMTEPAARELLEKLSSQFAGSSDHPSSPSEQADLIRHEYEVLTERVATSEKSNGQLEADLSKIRQMAGNAVQPHDQNEEMRQQMLDMETKLGELEQENKALNQQITRDWFYAGVLVLLAGLFLGLVIPRIQWHRRARYGAPACALRRFLSRNWTRNQPVNAISVRWDDGYVSRNGFSCVIPSRVL